jgi:ABC-type amino acid transport substrate-binding protein
VAEALDYANGQGLVHRDIKPSNVLLDAQGQAVLADFGVAKLVDALTTQLTMTSQMVGTPEYMAPEQLRNQPVTAATDVFGLGALAYHLLTGQAPFAGTSLPEVIQRVMFDTPTPLRQVRIEVPPAAEAVVLKALAKDPAMRFASAGAVARALAQGMRGEWPAGVEPPLATPPTQAVQMPVTMTPSPTPLGQAAPVPLNTPSSPPSPPLQPPQVPNPSLPPYPPYQYTVQYSPYAAGQAPTPSGGRPARRGSVSRWFPLYLVIALLVVAGSGFAIFGRGPSGPGTGLAPTSTAITSVVPTASATISCPSASTMANWHLVNSGQLTIASDTTYAPAEYADPNNPSHYIGYDMDLAREFARRLCLSANIEKATFSNIIPDISTASLGQQRYDMSISSFTINSARLTRVDMIPYFTAGESILTMTANPANIKSINDMCGKNVAVQTLTVELSELEDANGTGDGSSGQAPVCKTNKITIITNDDQSVVVDQVLTNHADASYQDEPVTDFYVLLHKGQLIDSGITVQPSPEGIVMRKDNAPLEMAITSTLAAMRSDGTYLRILTAWGAQNMAYPACSNGSCPNS